MEQVKEILDILRTKSLVVSTAESCTGGLIAAAITDIPGSSAVFDRGFVTYSNKSKQEMLGVSKEIITKHGAVSHECADAMAQGALKNSNADIAISVTGIAGPDGGSEEKPVGLVYIAAATKDNVDVRQFHFDGTRQEIRELAVSTAFDLLTDTAFTI